MATKYPKWPQNIPNGRKIYQMVTKYTKRPHNKPIDHKITQMATKYTKMATKYTNIVRCKTLRNLPQLGFFWFENIPSGNPADYLEILSSKKSRSWPL
jgi:hypothetical protein